MPARPARCFQPRVNRLHRSFPDPAAVAGTELERRQAFREVRDSLERELTQFAREIGGGHL
jgi:hypothetical protein